MVKNISLLLFLVKFAVHLLWHERKILNEYKKCITDTFESSSVFVTDVSDVENNRVLFKDIFAAGTEKWNNPQSVSEGKLDVASTTTANDTRALSDFVLKIKADTTSETGILFRMLDEYDNYNWNFYNRDGSIVLVPEIMLNGKEIILEEVPTNIPVSENTEISIECIQDTIKTCINGKQVSLVHDKAQRYGEIGFKKGRFAEVTVTMLPGKAH